MNTFLPYKSFKQSARCLDNKRLGKQRVECYQIMLVLLDLQPRLKNSKKKERKGWKNHPAVLMWKGYEGQLYIYWTEISDEWKKRGFKNEGNDLNLKYVYKEKVEKIIFYLDPPKWLGKKIFHSSHRSNLLRKDKVYYSQFKWKEADNLEYYWPIQKEKVK
jgi:hypothetical protein